MSGQWPPEWEDPDDERPDSALPDGQRPDDGHSDLELSEVTSFLASVRGPALPASFEARISAAIAAEAAARAASEPRAAAEPAGPLTAAAEAGDAKDTDRSGNPEEFSPAATAGGRSTPARRRPRRGSQGSGRAAAASGPGGSRPGGGRRRLRMPSMQAASWTLVCVLVLAGFGFLVTRGGGSSSSSQAESSPASQPAASAAGPAGKQPDTEHAAGTLPEAASSASSSAGSTAGPRNGFLVYSTGVAYQRSTLASQVRAELDSPALGGRGPVNSANATASAPAPAASASAASSSVSGALPTAQLSGCVSEVTGGAAPSLVDKASYDGIPAYIIAVPTRVWVVGRGCTAADTQLIVQAPLKG
jgi:hypothetical protein